MPALAGRASAPDRNPLPSQDKPGNVHIARTKANGTKSVKAIGRPALKRKKVDAARAALAEGMLATRRQYETTASIGRISSLCSARV
jgi:hypothetical protein